MLYALGDEIRMDIVRQLDQAKELACGEFSIEKPKSSLSHHFRVLRESGIVSTRRTGTLLLNALRRDDLESQFPGLLKAVLRANGPARREKAGAALNKRRRA